MGNCIRSQEVNQDIRQTIRYPRAIRRDIVEPENQEQAIQQQNRLGEIYFNQQRIQQPIHTSSMNIHIIRPLNLIAQLNNIAQILDVIENDNYLTDVNKYNTYVYDNQYSNPYTNTCTICLENYKKGELIIELPCKHLFHKECLSKWFNHNNICPLCKSNC